MNKELSEILNSGKDFRTKQKMLELIFVVKAWEKLSKEEKLEKDLTFEQFYNNKIEVKKMASIFEKLSKSVRLFELYRFDSKLFDNETLAFVLGQSKNLSILPNVNDTFYHDKDRNDFSISNQIAELGVKLLDIKAEELYVPFTNGFAYILFTDKKVYADFMNIEATFVAELISILEDKDIEFSLTNALENPTFINENAPHLLEEFDYVLSFPPLGMKGKIDSKKDEFHRFKFSKGSILDVAYFEHILSQTKTKTVVLMPVGFTYRSGSEEQFRKYLIDNNYLEAVIQLPPNLHNATSIETTFIVINKNKNSQNVQFINLKDDSFITRDGRKLVLKSVDEIVNIYRDKNEIENISAIVTNVDIEKNNYSFSIDRYIISREAKELQKALDNYQLIILSDIANIRRSQLFKDEEEGRKIYEISPSDFSSAGFTKASSNSKKIGSQESRLSTYKLEPFDVLLSTKGTIGKVAIMDEFNDDIVASQAIQVIRVKDDNKKDSAIALYMFLKSDIGQTLLSVLVSGSAMPQISTSELKNMKIPLLSKEEQKRALSIFKKEIELYKKINKLQDEVKLLLKSFLGDTNEFNAMV